MLVRTTPLIFQLFQPTVANTFSITFLGIPSKSPPNIVLRLCLLVAAHTESFGKFISLFCFWDLLLILYDAHFWIELLFLFLNPF